MNNQTKSIALMRWIAVLPIAVVSAWLAWFVVVVVNRFTMGFQGSNPNSFLSRVFIEFVSHGAMGFAFVYVGARIAPFNNKQVAYALAAIGLLAAGFLLFPAIFSSNYWAAWASLSLALAVAITAYSINNGEIEV